MGDQPNAGVADVSSEGWIRKMIDVYCMGRNWITAGHFEHLSAMTRKATAADRNGST